jgi:hypothetical protein
MIGLLGLQRRTLIRGICVECRVRCRVRVRVCEVVEESDVSADVLVNG